jgi:hypothetical protein
MTRQKELLCCFSSAYWVATDAFLFYSALRCAFVTLLRQIIKAALSISHHFLILVALGRSMKSVLTLRNSKIILSSTEPLVRRIISTGQIVVREHALTMFPYGTLAGNK